MAPRRLQRDRRESWGHRTDQVYVGGGSPWENPFRSSKAHPEAAVAEFDSALAQGRLPFTVEDVKERLSGKDLVCWCRLDEPCHGDVLLRWANGQSAAS